MAWGKTVRLILVAMVTIGMVLPPALCADAPDIPTTAPTISTTDWMIRDVALDETSSLNGRCVDSRGHGEADLPVRVLRNNVLVAEATTDAGGEFQIADLRGAVYQLQVGDQTALYRCWAPGTAPPHASTAAAVSSEPIVRGQSHPLARGLSNPWVITGIALAAVAIPVAIHNHRDDRTPASQ